MRLGRLTTPIIGLAIGMLTSGQLPPAQQAAAAEMAPEFTHQAQHDWINSGPLSLKAMRGGVVLIDFWAFECWNCYRSFPWLNDVHERFAGHGLRVIGVHSPEYPQEHDRAAVAAKVHEFRLAHPVMIDNDFSYWKALGNQYWPAYYLIDKQGRLRYRFVGETHRGDARALEIEKRIGELLAE